MNQLLHGIIPPIVTPFDAEDRVSEPLLRSEVSRLISCGIHGLAVCGSTGEGHTLTADEARTITAAAVEEARGRVPVIAGIIVNSTRAVIERALAVADLGVAALQVTPVHYLFRPDDDAMVRHFSTIADRTGLPVIIYNVVPWAYLQPGLLAAILQRGDGVVGVKQSASDMKALADLLLLLEASGWLGKVTILSAVDALLYPSFALGAHGAVAAILTAAPELCVQLWNAVQRGDHACCRRLHCDLLRLWNAIEAPNLPANVKAAMRLQGREGGLPRPPMPESSAAQTAQIREALAAASKA